MHEEGTLAYSHAAFIHDGVTSKHYKEQQLSIDSLCNQRIDFARSCAIAIRPLPIVHIAIESSLPLPAFVSPSEYHSSSAHSHLDRRNCGEFPSVIPMTKTCVRQRTSSAPQRGLWIRLCLLRDSTSFLLCREGHVRLSLTVLPVLQYPHVENTGC